METKMIVRCCLPFYSSDIFTDHINFYTEFDGHYRYWSFMEAHPSHAQISPAAHAEALDALTWSYTGKDTSCATLSICADY